MSLPSPVRLEENINEEQEKIRRLEEARSHFLIEWKKIENEQKEIADSLRQYLEKIKMRDVLETIHSIKE